MPSSKFRLIRLALIGLFLSFVGILVARAETLYFTDETIENFPGKGALTRDLGGFMSDHTLEGERFVQGVLISRELVNSLLNEDLLNRLETQQKRVLEKARNRPLADLSTAERAILGDLAREYSRIPLGTKVPLWILQGANLTIEEWLKKTERERIRLECVARIGRYRQSGIPIPDRCLPHAL